MTTANDIATGALRVVTSVTPGEPVDGTEAAYALGVLNRMLKAWSAQGLMIPYRTIESFTPSTQSASYTIGSGGNFDTVRPDKITAMFRRYNNVDTPIQMISNTLYNPISYKSAQGVPYEAYYDPQYPLGIIYLYNVDSVVGAQLFIDSWKPMTQFTTLQSTMNLPGEYEEAMVYLLAKRLAPEYGFTMSQDVADLIKQAEDFIMRRNTTIAFAQFDAALKKAPNFNIYAG